MTKEKIFSRAYLTLVFFFAFFALALFVSSTAPQEPMPQPLLSGGATAVSGNITAAGINAFAFMLLGITALAAMYYYLK